MDHPTGPLPDLAPRGALGGIVVAWSVAALGGIAIALFAPVTLRAPWLGVALGLSVAVAFAIQLWYGRSQRFLFRVGASVLGSLVILGVISAALGLAALSPG